jgi:hypothetical protein
MSGWLPKLYFFRRNENTREDERMELFLGMLDVRLKCIEADVSKDEHSQLLLQDLKTEITKMQRHDVVTKGESIFAAWNKAYRLERLLAVLEPSETLTFDLDRRLNEATAKNLPSAERLRSDVTAAKEDAFDASKQPPALNPGGSRVLRTALIALIEEIHWDAQRNFQAWPMQREAVQRIVFLVLGAFIVVMAPYILWLFLPDLRVDWLPTYVVLTVGAFGAYFSRLQYIFQDLNNSTMRESESTNSWSVLILRGVVGMCGALFIFFFL